VSTIKKSIFFGIGNRDRGDDGVGPMLAETLAADESLRQRGVEVIPHSGEGASLMDIWEGAGLVVIVDAMKSGTAVGTIRRFDAEADRLSGGTFRYSSHLFSLAEAVEMARQLGRLPDRLIIYGIEGRDFAFGAPLTPEVAAALQGVTDSVYREFGLR